MFVGRENELSILNNQLSSATSSYIAVYGRRRIGKTEMIRYFCATNEVVFAEFTGNLGVTTKNQIKAFADKIKIDLEYSNPMGTPTNWQDAFRLLTEAVKQYPTVNNKKIVLFLDEIPWLDSARSGFLEELNYFYNNFVSKVGNIILIVCGSAASYMLKKIVHNKGTGHNRLTHVIPMYPFDVNTTNKMVKEIGCHYSLKSILDLYAVLGGVAKYLSYLSPKNTPHQNIQNIIFGKTSMMSHEYDDLFSSLFAEHDTHYKIMDLLSSKWSGYSKAEIAKKLNKPQNLITKPLEELEASGFVMAMPMFNHQLRDTNYRASDPFSFFHNKWLSGLPKSAIAQVDFLQLSNTPSYKSWSGFAFENICFMHLEAIKKAIGISGVPTKANYWQHRPADPKEKGAQIDILLEHNNRSRNVDIIECKYCDGEFVIKKGYCDELKNKITAFNKVTGGRYNIRLVLITIEGVSKNEYYNELGCIDLTAQDIFV
jgi:uncharacterized protein